MFEDCFTLNSKRLSYPEIFLENGSLSSGPKSLSSSIVLNDFAFNLSSKSEINCSALKISKTWRITN
jgi:hypothetical protein